MPFSELGSESLATRTHPVTSLTHVSKCDSRLDRCGRTVEKIISGFAELFDVSYSPTMSCWMPLIVVVRNRSSSGRSVVLCCAREISLKNA